MTRRTIQTALPQLDPARESDLVDVPLYVVLYAIRYGLGRSTYAHGDAVRLIRTQAAKMPPAWRASLIDDLDAILDRTGTGLSPDERAELEHLIEVVASGIPVGGGHSITWTLDRGYVEGRVTCAEPDHADCHLVGPSDCSCESWLVLHDDDGTAYHLEEHDPTRRHLMAVGDRCNVVDWMMADPSILGELADPEAPSTVAVGTMPVSVRWIGNEFAWTPLASGVTRG